VTRDDNAHFDMLLFDKFVQMLSVADFAFAANMLVIYIIKQVRKWNKFSNIGSTIIEFTSFCSSERIMKIR